MSLSFAVMADRLRKLLHSVTVMRRAPAPALIVLLGIIATAAQVPKSQKKPTELVIRRYEEFIADGSLLTPEGWKRASKLFAGSHAYSPSGEIWVVSTGGLVGEDWVKGDRAQVETKWNDSFGTIDSSLRLKPPDPSGSITMVEIFSLVFVRKQSGTKGTGEAPHSAGFGDWKIEGPQRVRTATIPVVIRYLTEMRDQSDDPVVRRNAAKTIAALKRLGRGCGSASAC
jgi:hypothetical protein